MSVNFHKTTHQSACHPASGERKHHATKAKHHEQDCCDIQDGSSHCTPQGKKHTGKSHEAQLFKDVHHELKNHLQGRCKSALSALKQGWSKVSGHVKAATGAGKPSGSHHIPPTHAGPITNSGSGHTPHGINLSKFGALQLPTGKSGHPDTISGGKLANYNGPSFQQGNGKITFSVPKGGGVTTKNSQFARSEMKENHTWNAHSGTSTIGGTVSIDQPPGNGTVTFSQIHQERKDGKPPRPPVELEYKNGKIVASIMTGLNSSGHSNRQEVEIASGIKPGEKFNYSMKLAPNGQLQISAAGHTKSVHLNPSVTDQPMYFKAGNYPQDKNGGSKVSFYDLDISH